MRVFDKSDAPDFPSFLEGLSLRPFYSLQVDSVARGFPFLLGRAFFEAKANNERFSTQRFPYSFVGTLIEAGVWKCHRLTPLAISLPFPRDLH